MNTTDQAIVSTLIGRRVDAVTGSDNEARIVLDDGRSLPLLDIEGYDNGWYGLGYAVRVLAPGEMLSLEEAEDLRTDACLMPGVTVEQRQQARKGPHTMTVQAPLRASLLLWADDVLPQATLLPHRRLPPAAEPPFLLQGAVHLQHCRLGHVQHPRRPPHGDRAPVLSQASPPQVGVHQPRSDRETRITNRRIR